MSVTRNNTKRTRNLSSKPNHCAFSVITYQPAHVLCVPLRWSVQFVRTAQSSRG